MMDKVQKMKTVATSVVLFSVFIYTRRHGHVGLSLAWIVLLIAIRFGVVKFSNLYANLR